MIQKAHLHKSRSKLKPEHRLKVIQTLEHGFGKKNNNWKGGLTVTDKGYIKVRIDGKYISEHRLVMEKHIGRKLTKEDYVHHLNGDTMDNRVENLQLVTTHEHGKIHWDNEEAKLKQSRFMKEVRKKKFWSTRKIT